MDVWFSTNLTNINTINSFFWLDRLWIVLCWTWVRGMVSTPSNLLAWTMEHSMQLGDPLAWQQKLWTQQTHLESIANHKHQVRFVYTHKSKCSKYDLTVGHCFSLAHHNDWSRWFAISSPQGICCPSFSSMGGVAKE